MCSQAEEAIQEALRNATDNPHTHFLAFKLALVQEDTDKGTVRNVGRVDYTNICMCDNM